VAGFAVIVQAGRIQTVEGEYWRNLADSTTLSYVPIDAERGNILSSDGRLLATSLPFFEVRFDINTEALTDDIFNASRKELAQKMSSYFGDKSAKEYENFLIKARKNGQRYVLIRKNITYPELQTMKTWPIFELGRYKGGFIAIQHNKRVMPFRMLAHRTIGYTRDDIKPVGLEGYFDNELAGVRGKRLMQKIAGGAWIPVNDENEISSENGKDVLTTLDVNLQDVVETALLEAVTKHAAAYGTAILMEVETGKIKAIANVGKTKDSYWENFNYAVGEATEPGSTMKLAAALALLEDGHISLNDSIDLELGSRLFYDKTMRDSEKHNFRNVTIKHAFEVSSNVAFAKLIDKYYNHQPEKYIAHLKNFGLDELTGVEIKGEAAPYIKDPSSNHWSGISLPWMAVGYEWRLTPLQILTFYNAIANDGHVVKPYLVDQIQKNGKTITKFKPEISKRQICSDKSLKQVRQMLEGVIENGTGDHLYSKNYKFAGKTGTAQIVKSGRYEKVYQASFAGYFPAENPKYSCIVVINSPSNGVFYGGWVAGPVFREIADKVYAMSFDMHPDANTYHDFLAEKIPFLKPGYKPDAMAVYEALDVKCDGETDGLWVSYKRQTNNIHLTEKEMDEKLVPNVQGMGLKDALYLLENYGLTVQVKGKGRVRQQSLTPGTVAAKGQTILIELS
jgi:cell division protein FtsI (penicillin-binding protein 3)